jgi:hypothetical protein
MPRLSQLIIRTALVWLAVGSAMGGLLLLNKGIPILPWLWVLRFPHVHALLVGWMVQFACGVAFWILPRLDAQGRRGNHSLVWLCYIALNSGVVLAASHDPLVVSLGDSLAARIALVIAGVLYVIASASFVIHAARRVVSFRMLPRPNPTRSHQDN